MQCAKNYARRHCRATPKQINDRQKIIWQPVQNKNNKL